MEDDPNGDEEDSRWMRAESAMETEKQQLESIEVNHGRKLSIRFDPIFISISLK